jgi:hypothetical protein
MSAAHLSLIRVGAVVGLACVLTACSPDTPLEIPEPQVVEEVETCDGVVDVAEDYVRLMAAELADAPRDVVTGETPATPRLAALGEIAEILDDRAVRLACEPLELRTSLNERITDLESDHPVVSLFLDIVREEGAPPVGDG